jgi:hypothetical protein
MVPGNGIERRPVMRDTRDRLKLLAAGSVMTTLDVPVDQPPIPLKPPPAITANPPLDRVFFSCLAGLMLAAVFVGFAQSYYLYGIIPLPHWKRVFAPPHPLVVHIHGVVLSAWFLLLTIQTSLIAAHRRRIHMQLGMVGIALACLVVLLGFGVLCEHLARAYPPGDQRIAGRGGGSFTTIFDLIVFGVLASLAFQCRRRPAAHKRLIMIASLGLLPPALMRWPIMHGHSSVAFVTIYGVLIAMLLFDLLSRKRMHPATLGAGLLYVALRNVPLDAVLARNTTWWLDLATHAQSLGRHLY